MAEGEDKDARRHPLNMEGILRFCIENTKNEDVQNPDQFQQMSEEDTTSPQAEEELSHKKPCDSEAQPDTEALVNGSSSTAESDSEEASNMVKSAKGQRLLLKRCKAVEDLDDGNNDLAMIEEILQSTSSSGETQNDAASACSDTASQAESLPDIEAARRNQDHALATLGLYRYKIPSDGNCMFRAVASQLNLDQDKYHALLRQVSVKWMRQHLEELLGAGLLDSEEDIDEMVSEGSWPNQAALVALSNVLSMNIAVIQGGDKGSIDIQHITPITPPPEEEQTGIKLAYLYNGHYDSVVNEPNLSNPTYAMWAAQFMKDNTNLSRSSEDLLQREKSQEPYLPYAEYKSPWHRKEKVPEGDARRSLSATPDPLDSDCSALSEAEEKEMPTFDVENVTIPNVCTFVTEIPEQLEHIMIPMKSMAMEEPQENLVHFSPILDKTVTEESSQAESKPDNVKSKTEKRRSALFIMVGGSSLDDNKEEDLSVSTSTLSKSRSMGDLGTSVSLDSEYLGPMAENVKEEIILPDPVAENSCEFLMVSPPRTILSPPILQSPVVAKIFPARKGGSQHETHHVFTVNVTEPKLQPQKFDLGTYYPPGGIGEVSAKKTPTTSNVTVNPRPIVPVCTPNVMSRILSHTVKLVPVKPAGAPSSSSPVPESKVHMNPLQASIKANGPVKITMPKEGFLRGVTDPNQIKVERKPFSVHVPHIQQMNYMWVTKPGENVTYGVGNPGYHEKTPLGTYAHSANPSVEQLWEKNMWSRSSPAGQSCHSEPHDRVNAGENIHVEIPTCQHTWMPSSKCPPQTHTHGLGYTNSLMVNSASPFFPTHQVDFSRSTQTNLKLSSPVFPGQECAATRGQCGGTSFNLERFLSPLRRDVDAEYIENLLKQQWFR